ncbi:MAG: M14 family zinc carboxypeptidase [Chthoniobacterales bacterium]
MKKNGHPGNTTKKSAARARFVFRAFGVVAAVTLAGAALAAGREHLSARSSKSQSVPQDSDASTASVQPQAGSGKNPMAEKDDTLVMRVYFRDRAERDRLAQELNAEEVPTTGGYLTVIRDRDLYYGLLARGLRVEIDENSSRNLSDPQIMIDTFYGGYKSVEEIYTFLDQKVAQFPNLVEKVDIGDSWCKSHPGSCVLPSPWNGYDLFVLHITNRNIPGPKPVFWADGDIHAREIATPEVLMRMIDYLLNNYNTNADVHWLVDHHDIWLMPEVNPDGHHVVEAGGGGNSPYMYRKNGNNVGGGACSWPPTPSNHFGVDANRNFPFHWGCCGGSSTFACDQTYRGTGSGSEPEDTAIVNQIRSLVPDQRGPGDTDAAPLTATGVYQNIHTVVPVNLFTWGWSATQMPNYAETRNIAAHMAAPNAGGNGYPYGSIIEQLYPVDGGSIDWAYGELGMAAFSTELSGQDFLPPFSCIDNPGCGTSQGIWPENRGMLLYLAKIARTPYLTSHGPDANNVVATPASVAPGVPSQLTASITFAWTSNAFSQNVGAAEYYIDTPPWAGGTAIPMTGTFTSTTVSVSATINTAGLTPGRHVIFLRGRGTTDFSGFQTWGPIGAAFLDVTGGPTATPTATPVVTATPSPTATPVVTPTATVSPTPVITPTATASPTPAITPTASPSATTSPTPGTTPTATATPTSSATPTASPASQPLNLSTRMLVLTGDNVGIGGFIITGTGKKNVLIRAIGPSLNQFGVPNPLADPVLVLHLPGITNTFINDNWKDDPTQRVLIEMTGLQPTNDFESAIVARLDPGAYTAVVSGKNNTTGVGLVEIYDLDGGVPSKLGNISTRAFVSTGSNIVIAGFILGGNSGNDRIVVRGIGPSLVGAGVSNALADPTLELRDGNGALLMTNNNWQDDPAQAAELVAAGLAPTNPLESAIAATLPPGSYTALLAGVNNTTGVGLVEVYDRGQ